LAGEGLAGAGLTGAGLVGAGTSAFARSRVLLLKLDANGFLQRAKRAQLFGGGKCQRAPG
jgi:hypothetical protein